MEILKPKYITTPSVYYTKEIDLTDVCHRIDMLNYIYSVYDIIKRMYEDKYRHTNTLGCYEFYNIEKYLKKVEATYQFDGSTPTIESNALLSLEIHLRSLCSKLGRENTYLEYVFNKTGFVKKPSIESLWEEIDFSDMFSGKYTTMYVGKKRYNATINCNP